MKKKIEEMKEKGGDRDGDPTCSRYYLRTVRRILILYI